MTEEQLLLEKQALSLESLAKDADTIAAKKFFIEMAKAIRLEILTGIIHCCCCLLPLARHHSKNRNYIKRRIYQ